LKKKATPQNKLEGAIWYTVGVNNWQYSDLLDPIKTPKPAYWVWKDWPIMYCPMMVRSAYQSRGMSGSAQSEQLGAYPPPIDGSAPGIDQPGAENNQAPYPAPDLIENAAPSVDSSLEQYTPTPPMTPFPTETPTPRIDPALEQYSPTPPLTPFPTETPTPGVDPALEQYSPTPYPAPAS
jgi:hypothetical protein